MGIPVAPAVTPRSRTAVADAPSTDARMAVPAAPLVVNAKLSDAVSPTCAGPQPRRSRKLSSAASSTDATGKSLSTSHWYAVPVGSPMPSAARAGIFVCAAVVITSNAGLGIVASAGNRYTKLTPAPPPSLQVRDVVASTSAAPFTGSASCGAGSSRSEEHTSELQSHVNLVCRLLLEKKNKNIYRVLLLTTHRPLTYN